MAEPTTAANAGFKASLNKLTTENMSIIVGISLLLIFGILSGTALFIKSRKNKTGTERKRQSTRNKLNEVSSFYNILSYPRQSQSGIETRVAVLNEGYNTNPRPDSGYNIGEPTPPESDTDIGQLRFKHPQIAKLYSKEAHTRGQPPTPPTDHEYEIKRYPSFSKGRHHPFQFNIPSRDVLSPSGSPTEKLKNQAKYDINGHSLSDHPMYKTSMMINQYNSYGHGQAAEEEPSIMNTGWKLFQ
ncbi:hypothetical protein BB559_000104 [Furculomyces boomerangus]|uniref:Uncharacterized protein n=2 Tax=Harpellales TaxID=61421 RepID=A0A2T9Z6A3_9FUNG|nr:hypothetical protein BB559_004711 [Furculomyces boomerangus]PVV00113.1 hypothetical protein BB559_000104 [Furculomyces boomerangus]PWA00560.1 hypothetical protein BB558_003377 [Smittium angustum]